jgi:putative GTP pyrophosphokinase
VPRVTTPLPTPPPHRGSTPAGLDASDVAALAEFRQLRDEFTRFMLGYRAAIQELETKISILRDEFTHLHDSNPIEHVSSRLKSPESLIDKVERKGCDPSFEAIRENITDIAGVRITCSFVADTYRIFDALTAQDDLRVVQVKDYIKKPKSNGYKSLHAIVEVPVFLSDGPMPVLVEIQIRTVAMDFWASLEHKIYYKYDRQVPARLLDDLKQAADTAARLDATMEALHDEVLALDADERTASQQPVAPADHAVRALREVRRQRGATGMA